MAADILSLARSYYDAAICDPVELASLKADAASLRSAIRRGQRNGTITGAMKNSVNMQMRPDMSHLENLKAMDWALAGVAANTRPSNIAYGRM